MELILQQGLPHQQKAIDAICGALEGVSMKPPKQFYENPQIELDGAILSNNIIKVQNANSIAPEYRSSDPIESCLNLDIKMETGTGKTYVYTKAIYELHKRWGLNKFIVAVPSLAIKAGTEQFMKDDYARRHFTDSCGYGADIELGVLEAPKNKKKDAATFPVLSVTLSRAAARTQRKFMFC